MLLKENPNVVHICLGNSVDRANKVKPTNHKSSYWIHLVMPKKSKWPITLSSTDTWNNNVQLNRTSIFFSWLECNLSYLRHNMLTLLSFLPYGYENILWERLENKIVATLISDLSKQLNTLLHCCLVFSNWKCTSNKDVF